MGDDLRLLHVDVIEPEIARGWHVKGQITDPDEEPSIHRVGDAPTPSFRVYDRMPGRGERQECKAVPKSALLRKPMMLGGLIGYASHGGSSVPLSLGVPFMSRSTVAENQSSVSEMKDLTSTSFGYLIAFLLPGVFGLYALGYWFPPAYVLLQPLFNADATVGPSVIFLLISVGMGLFVSALRHLMFERLLCLKHKFPKGLFARLVEEHKLSYFKAVTDEHYRYHQFYGGCAVVLIVLFTGWLHENWEPTYQLAFVSIGFLLLEALLISAGRQTYIKYIERGGTILKAPAE